MYRKLSLALFLGLMVGILAACGETSSGDGEAEEAETNANDNNDATDDEVYTVATDNAYVPFEYLDEETDELVEFDIDLIKALAEEAGIEIEIETLEFSGIVAGLGSGKFDIGIAGMTITEDRKENIDFTQPYYEAGLI